MNKISTRTMNSLAPQWQQERHCWCCLYCCLTHSSCTVEVTGLTFSGCSDGSYWMSARVPPFVSPCCLCIVCWTSVQHVPVLYTCCTRVVHVLYTCVFCVIFCGMRLSYAQSHSNDSRVHATVPCSVCALAQAHSTMSSIRLVLVFPGNSV